MQACGFIRKISRNPSGALGVAQEPQQLFNSVAILPSSTQVSIPPSRDASSRRTSVQAVFEGLLGTAPSYTRSLTSLDLYAFDRAVARQDSIVVCMRPRNHTVLSK